MQVGVGFRPRVLLRHPGAELDVLANRFTERLVVRQAGLVEGLQVRGDEPLPLLVGDVEVPVHIDDVPEAELAGEAVRTAEGLGREPGQMIHVGRDARREQRLQHRVGEGLGVEQLLQPMQPVIPVGVLVERLHHGGSSLRGKYPDSLDALARPTLWALTRA